MSKEFKHIVRILGKDLDGAKSVAYAITQIKGISIRLADAIAKKVGINPNDRLGFLSETEIKKIEEMARNPGNYDLPKWFLNRRKDLDTGKDRHLVSSDLDLQIKNDIESMKTIRSWRGYRHAYGLKVRGQKTRTTGRTGKAMGVKKKGREIL